MELESCHPVLLEGGCAHERAGDEILFVFPLVAAPLQAQSLRGAPPPGFLWTLLPMLGILMEDLGLEIGRLPPRSAHGVVNYARVVRIFG